jgi:hypothetical protein
VALNGGTLASLRWVDLCENATLTGFGTVDASLYNEGTLVIASGTTGVAVNGNYSQSASATLNAVVRGHTALTVKGDAAINGTLGCTLASGFLPQPGDRFTILTAHSVTGQFSNAQGTVDIAGQHFRILYTADTVALEKMPDAPQGSVNR